MRVEVTLVDPLWDMRNDVVLEADDASPTREVLDGLLGMLSAPVSASVISLAGRRHGEVAPDDPGRTLYLRGEALDPDVPIAESGIKEGSLISVGDPGASILTEPEGLVEIWVVTGPGAGAVHRLTMGEATIGSDPSCVIALNDDRVPPVCVTMSVHADGKATVRPVDDSATVLAETVPHAVTALAMEREALAEDEDTEWPVGGQLTVGDIKLELAAVSLPDAAIEDSPDPGWYDYNRPPRLLPPDRQTQFSLPTLPGEQQNRGIPWLMVLTPVVAAVIMAILFRRPAMLTMAFFSPMMMLGNYMQSRKTGKMTHRQQLADYKDKKKRIEEDVEQAVVDERHARRMDAPDPSFCLLIASGPRMRLWERRTSDPDYLSLRLGVGDLVSEVTVNDPEQLEHRRKTIRTAYDVPVTIPLAERGVIGIGGAGDLPRRLACWAIAQFSVLQSPRDTQVYVLTDRDGAPAWDWLRWVPHAQPQMGQDTNVTIGIDAETCARRVAELSRVLAARQQAAGERSKGSLGPDIVVVFDGARRLRSLPGVVAILKQGPALGIYSIGLDSDERMLPEEASAVVLQTAQGLTLKQQQLTVVDAIVPDLVEGPWFNRVARMLAPIRDISGGDSDSVLPSACRLTEVMELEPLSADVVKARWTLTPRSTEAVVGISLDGPFSIDMVRDGPHGLVAGTTGAGKSELLQSIVASLAIANRPDGMTFVLVDYKGGAAFKDCVDLPHTVGMVTDLDTHLVERALVSLGAELTRREHLLADAEAKDIEDYIDIQAKRPLPDMPRLLIVIDEFASLARELPDFVTGLVNVAQRGRSLGIHLILATQRPGGVVSPEIRANTNLRIALRVTDASESSDVINAPDSGMISKSTPGRAFVRLGAQSLVPFQSGRVGGRRPGAAATATSKPWLTELELEKLAQPIPMRPKAKVVDDAEVTDLKVLVASVVQATEQLGLAQQHSPWLPALTTDVQLRDLLEDVEIPALPQLPAVPFAVEDLPAQQDRRGATIDFDTFSHLAIMGGPRSGRSQALRTMAASVAQLTSPADVHIFGLDCGNGALLPLQSLPHCGAVVQRTQVDRATRLLNRMMVEVTRRQELLGAGGYADLGELRSSVVEADRLPHILFLVDRWEGFMGSLAEADNGRPYEQIQTLLREGASVGVHLVLAGDRLVVNTRLSALVEDKIGLRIPDKADYGLIGLHPRKMPDEVPEGRGFRSESGIELQFALLTEDPSGQTQAAELRRIGDEATEKYAAVPRSQRPFRVDVLPARIGFDEAWKLLDGEPRPLWALAGVGGDELTAVGFDLTRTNTAVMAGAPRSGRSTALLSAVESLLRTGTDVVIAAPRQSPLRDLAGRDGVRHVFTDVAITTDELEPLMDPTEKPVVFVVDDGELLKDVEAKDYLRTVIRTGSDKGQGLILGGDSSEVASGFTGWQVDCKGRQGILISPQGVTDGELIGIRLPRSSVGGQAHAGRALANDGSGVLQTIQVATPG